MSNRKLIEMISALLALDEQRALVPHGVGGHGRELLERSANALAEHDALAAQRDEGLTREAGLQRRLAEAKNQVRLVAHTAGELLEQVINATEFFDDPISKEEIDETNAVIDSALAFAGPDSADGESAECAHSYANKLGCPECGEDFGK